MDGQAAPRDRLICQQNPEAWFATGPANDPVLAAQLCAGCPLLQECLELALKNEGRVGTSLRFGVWGGTTPYMRSRISRNRVDRNRRSHVNHGAGPAADPAAAKPGGFSGDELARLTTADRPRGADGKFLSLNDRYDDLETPADAGVFVTI